MLENIVTYYRKSDGWTKNRILGCIFSEKLVLEKGRVATTPFTTPIQVLFNARNVLEKSKNKKEVENDLLSSMAPLIDRNCSQNTLFEFITIRKLRS